MIRPLSAPMSRFPYAVAFLLALALLAGCQDLNNLQNRLSLPQVGRSQPPQTAQPEQPPAPQPPAVQPPASVTDPGPIQVSPLPPPPPPLAAPFPPGGGVAPAPIEGPARIAFLAPLSGPAANIGQALLDAAQLALFDLGNEDFILLPRDTQGTPEGAAAAARAVLADGAALIVGPLTASETAAIAPLARAGQVNVLAFSSDRSIAGNGVFALGITPQAQVERIVAYSQAKGIWPVAALVPNNAFGDAVVDSLRQTTARLSPLGQGPVERYDPGGADISPVIRRLANYETRRAALAAQRRALEGRDDAATRDALRQLETMETLGDVGFRAILVPEGGDRLLGIAPLLAFYDIDPARVKLLGTSQWDDPRLMRELELAGGWFAAPSAARRSAFERRFREVFGHDAPRVATLGYDAVALAALLARGDEGADFSATALTDPSGFAGVDGIFRFRTDGTIERGLAVMEIRRDGMRVVDPAPETFVTVP